MNVRLIREVKEMPITEATYLSYRVDRDKEKIRHYAYLKFLMPDGAEIELRKSKVVECFGNTMWFKKNCTYVIGYDSMKSITSVSNLFGVWAFLKPNRIFYVELFRDCDPIFLNESVFSGKTNMDKCREQLEPIVAEHKSKATEVIKRLGAEAVDGLVKLDDSMWYMEEQMNRYSEGTNKWMIHKMKYEENKERNLKFLKTLGIDNLVAM